MTHETIYSSAITLRITGILASIDRSKLGPAREHLDRAYHRLVAIVRHIREAGGCEHCPEIVSMIGEVCLHIRTHLWDLLDEAERHSIREMIEPFPA